MEKRTPTTLFSTVVSPPGVDVCTEIVADVMVV